MYYFDYLDAHGLMSDETPGRTVENNILWHTLWCRLLAIRSEQIDDMNLAKNICECAVEDIRMCQDESGEWHPSPDFSIMPEEGFSRDNMIALTSWPEFREEGMKHWKLAYAQPQDTAYFAYRADKWYGKLILPITLLNMLGSCYSHSKCNLGILDTDGRVLSFLRLNTIFQDGDGWFARQYCNLVYNILAWRLYSYLDANPGEIPWFAEDPETGKVDRSVNAWRIVFALYFKDPNHPINDIAGQIWP